MAVESAHRRYQNGVGDYQAPRVEGLAKRTCQTLGEEIGGYK